MKDWYIATLIQESLNTKDFKILKFEILDWPGHISGQHCDIRLTAPDGYQAQRSYSIANSPYEGKPKLVEFGIELMPDGEVSPYLFQMKVGEQIEVKGPIGGHFIWQPEMAAPHTVVIGGGSGVVPFMSIIRSHTLSKIDKKLTGLFSFKSLDAAPYWSELTNINNPNLELFTTLSQEWPAEWNQGKGRFDKAVLLNQLQNTLNKNCDYFICGNDSFVETLSSVLVELKIDPARIKTERYGGQEKL